MATWPALASYAAPVSVQNLHQELRWHFTHVMTDQVSLVRPEA